MATQPHPIVTVAAGPDARLRPPLALGGALAGAAVALGLLGLLDGLAGLAAGPAAYVTHGAAYAVLGGLVGLLVERLTRRAEMTAALLDAQDALGDGTVITDPVTARILHATPAVGRLLDRSPQRVVGRHIADFVDPRDLPRVKERGRLRLAGHPVPSSYEVRLRGGEGRRIEATTGELELAGERMLVTLLRDVSERHAAERRDARVRSALDLRSVELAHANANANLAHFATVAAHDLSEPARAVTGFAELLRRRAGQDLDPRGREHLDAIERAGERLGAMLDGLRAYGAVGADDGTEGRVDLERVLDRVAAAVAPELERTGGQLERAPLPTVAGHPGQLEQVLHNLVGNALKYADEAPPRVGVAAARHGTAWRVTVADNGVGVPERQRSRIFEMFRRASSDAEVPGTGVGLAVCQRIVRSHGGDIWVDPAPGGGSAFSFTVPDPEVRP